MDDLTDRVVSTAQDLEEIDTLSGFRERFSPLEVKGTKTLGSEGVSDITVVLATGGPQIEVNVSRGTVSGYWGSDSHTTHANNDELFSQLHRFYKEQFELEQ